MTVARSQLVDTNVTPWYHVISGTVRGTLLLGEGGESRKQWIENRLEELTSIFAIEVAGFAVLDSHLHVLVHLSPARVDGWPDEEAVRRWGRLVPLRGKDRKPLPMSDTWVKQQLANPTLACTGGCQLRRCCRAATGVPSAREPSSRP